VNEQDIVNARAFNSGEPAATATGASALVAPEQVSRAFSISEFCRRYGIGRTKAYAEIAAHRLRAVKAGRRTLISLDDAESWFATLPSVQIPRPTVTPSRSSQ
jgi:excisionase family DNA binding protein